ncbi:MAG: hypothetical protein KKB59_10450 [Spirochaetes bacterium]|nr:hypothetical protein [Spirochaetota bacterium]
MKNRFAFALALILALAGCDTTVMPPVEPAVTPPAATNPVEPTPPVVLPGAPKKLVASNLKGLYLQAAPASRAIVYTSPTSARAVVSSSDATLGTVTATGSPQPATFTDADGASVSVSITRAAQLTNAYVLITYSYPITGGTASETATLNLSTGALAIVSAIPSDWGRIFARGEKAWYVSGGSIYRLQLSSGVATVISERAKVYMNSGMGGDLTDTLATKLWDSNTWIFADLSETVFAFTGGYQDFRAQAISAGGTIKDFGFQEEAYTLNEWQPTYSVSGGCHALYDDATGTMYVVRGRPIWDNDPSKVGGFEQTGGYVLHLYKETLNASLDRPLTLSQVPIAYAELTGSTTAQTMYIGWKYRTGDSILTFGGYSFKVSASAIASFDTGAVPVSHELPDGSTQPYYVSNWSYAGGEVYAGPTDTTDSIALVQMSTGAAAVKTLVSDPGITSWTVVGGLLFYTNATGTYRAAVDTNTGTLGTVEAYAGGAVVAVTQ